MHDRNHTGLFAVVLFLLWCVVPVQAQDDTGDNPLLRLLAYVPDTETFREFMTYGDLAGWNAAWGFDRIGSVQALEARSDAADPAVPATLFTMTRQTGAPNAVGPEYLFQENLRDFLGIDLLNTDRFIEAGNPPETLTAIESADAGALPALLVASGYAESTLGAATLFSRGEDYEINLRDGAVPRTGQLGQLNRVALLADTVIIARATAVAQSAVDAASGAVPSLAQNPVFRAGALAVSDPEAGGEGTLVGAIFMDAAQPLTLVDVLGSRATPAQVAALEAALNVAPAIPAYELAVFATRSRGEDSQLLLALVFPEGVDAQAAADALMMRMKRYASLRTDQPLTALWSERGVEIEWGRGQTIGGLPVALVSLSARNPTLQEDDTGRTETYVFSWQDMVYAMDLGFMAVTGTD